MPVDSSELLNGVGNFVSKAPIIGTVTKNPFYTALLISVIIVIVIIFVFRNVDMSDSDDSLYRLAFRAGVYSLFIVTAIQFLQNQHVINETNGATTSAKIDEVFAKVGGNGGISAVPVKPSVSNGAPSPAAVMTTGATTSIQSLTSGAPTQSKELFVPVGIDVSFI